MINFLLYLIMILIIVVIGEYASTAYYISSLARTLWETTLKLPPGQRPGYITFVITELKKDEDDFSEKVIKEYVSLLKQNKS